jgi:predicted aspartyl protease
LRRVFLELVRFAVVGSWIAGALLAATPPKNRPTHLESTIPRESIPVHILGGFLVLAEGQFGAQFEHQNFILDTGTSPSVLNARVARQLGLTLSPARVTAIGRDSDVAWVTVPQFHMGALHTNAATFFVTDLSDVERTWNVPIAGILGLDVLGKVSFRLDYERQLLEFGHVNTQGIPIGLSSTLNLPIAEVQINGKAMHLLVDTGTDHLVFFAKQSGAAAADSSGAALRGNSVAGTVPVQQAPALEFEWKGRRFQQSALIVAGGEEPLFDGLMSVRSMGFRSIALDANRHLIYLQR